MSFKRLLAKKPVSAIQEDSAHGGLKRTLSALNLVSLGIGCIIGAGIFVMTGQAAAQYAGPAIIISFVLAGLCCAFSALCYAELASMLPVSGSAYSYAYASLGELAAWVMGWLLLLEYGIAASTVAVGWSGYLVSFLNTIGIALPEVWTKPTLGFDSLTHTFMNTGSFNLPAFLGVAAVTTLLIFGVKESANVNNVMVIVKVAVILLFIVVGVAYVTPDNWVPFIPENTGVEGHYGWSGILRGAGVIFFAYVGFEAVSTASQEAKNPQRDIPIGILGSLLICTVLYMIVALVLTGIAPYKTLNVPDPLAVGVDNLGLPWLAFIVKIGALAGLSSVMLVLVYAQTRIFFTMSRDGLLPPIFSKIHPKFQTPWLNTIVVGSIIAIIASTTPIKLLGELVSLGTLLAFSIICFTVLYLRVRAPEMERPFKAPFFPIVPLLGIAFCGYLIWGLREMFITLKWYFLVGFIIYFAYGQFNSRLRKMNEGAAALGAR